MWTIIQVIFPSAIAYSIPLLMGALGGLYSERSGVTNLCIEGLMLFGCFSAAATIVNLQPIIGFNAGLVVGIIVAIIALPLSIALAIASGVDPACGIYTAIAAGFVISFLGGSRVQIAGPTAAFATIVAGIVATQGMGGLILATILAGIMLILMGVFKLGSLIKFIPHSY